jgi:hypothetical protein
LYVPFKNKAEFLLVLSVLSSKKESFLDTISTLDENIQTVYLKKIEKYILNEVEEGVSQRSEVNFINLKRIIV